MHFPGSTRTLLCFPLVDSYSVAYQLQGTSEFPPLVGISTEPDCGVCTPTEHSNTKAWEKISPFMGLNTESLQQHPLHLKGNFVLFCKLISCNQWILVASYPQLFKEARFLEYVFGLEKWKAESASFLMCFFHSGTKVKKWENEKTCSVTTEMWNKTLKNNLQIDNVPLKLRWKVIGERCLNVRYVYMLLIFGSHSEVVIEICQTLENISCFLEREN